MRPMILRQITLAESMVQAWKDVGGWFPRRERSIRSKLDLMRRHYGTENNAIINLGDMGFEPSDLLLQEYGVDPDLFFNRPQTVRALVKPGPTRRLIGALLPPDPREWASWSHTVDVWIKAPGQAGQGKTQMNIRVDELPEIPAAWDMQFHVTGQEYRVVTVGHKVVQVSERYGENGDRRYAWLGVRRAPDDVKEIARNGARALNDERTIIGWDVIKGDRTFILEGNTCPGTNTALAERIMKQVKGESYE